MPNYKSPKLKAKLRKKIRDSWLFQGLLLNYFDLICLLTSLWMQWSGWHHFRPLLSENLINIEGHRKHEANFCLKTELKSHWLWHKLSTNVVYYYKINWCDKMKWQRKHEVKAWCKSSCFTFLTAQLVNLGHVSLSVASKVAKRQCKCERVWTDSLLLGYQWA